ncbi:hypothetical protein [Sphingobacterium thalpophilum]|uniref:hypothetical protein n=1 Tax=Sphingobacterium thalpophilum TaxID=259 RepID=UPI003D96C83D
MENRIILENNQMESNATTSVDEAQQSRRPNLFQGRTDAEIENAKFPDWDILPPNQFINPRMKTR